MRRLTDGIEIAAKASSCTKVLGYVNPFAWLDGRCDDTTSHIIPAVARRWAQSQVTMILTEDRRIRERRGPSRIRPVTTDMAYGLHEPVSSTRSPMPGVSAGICPVGPLALAATGPPPPTQRAESSS